MNSDSLARPFYLIAKYRLGKLEGFIKIGDDKEEITKLFREKYGGDFGVTEESYQLLEVNAKDISFFQNGNSIYDFERQVNQDLFYHILGDFYNELEGDNFENDVFALRHYDWGESEEVLPNLEHKPSGFKLWWYKYPLRSPEVNMNINHEQFSSILYDCFNSTSKIVKYEVPKWWENKKRKEK